MPNMPKTKVSLHNAQSAYPLPGGLRSLIRRACAASLEEQAFETGAEISVTLVDDERIRALNRDFRQIDRSTDVLSFPLGEDGVYDINPGNGLAQLGDIVISLEHAARQAEEYGHSFEREVGYLTVHSMMHLLGYDHVHSEEEAAVMRGHEEAVMTKLRLPREEV